MTKIFDDLFITKDTIKQSALAFIQQGIDPIDTYIKGKELEEISKEIMAETKQSAIELLSESEENRINHSGCWISTKAVAPAYDFSDNPEWVELNFKIKQLEADRKKIEVLMIEASKYGELKDSEGRKITPAKISREASVTLQVTIPKE
jgi:hypothetical protein